MGKSIPYDYRVRIVKRVQSGSSYKELSKEFGYSESGIKKIWYTYKKVGEKAFKTNYENGGRPKVYDQGVRNLVKTIRDNQQGGAYVRSKLEQHHSEVLEKIPHERTLQRWWKADGTSRSKGRPNTKEKKVGLE